MKASDFASKGAELVGGDRAETHGDKHKNFANIAELWNAYLHSRKEPSSPLRASDIGIMMALLKIARTQSGARNDDDIVDAIGYLACAGEILGS